MVSNLKLRPKKIAFLFFLSSFSSVENSKAQDSIYHYLQGKTYNFDGLDRYLKDGFVATYHSQLGLNSNDELVEDDCVTNEGGNFDCRYAHFHKGYLVEGSTFTLHGQRGIVLYAGGNQVKNLNVNVSSPISESTALTAALSHLGATTYAWENAELETNIKDLTDDPDATHFPHGTLIISVPQISSYTSDNFKLMWKFIIDVLDSPKKQWYVYVDAIDGSIVSAFDRMDYGQFGTGDCLTEYNGWQKIRTYAVTIGTNWRLQSDKNIRTTVENLDWLPKDGDNWWHDWDERPWTSTHWATEQTWQYYYDRFGILGSDNKGLRLINIVGIDTAGYYDPGDFASSGERSDGDEIRVARRQNDVTPAALDILAHEYTHRHIAYSSKLNLFHKNFSDAGALNEGFSDIMGVLAERWVKGNSAPDWTIGEDVASPFPNPSVRRFNDPHTSTHPQAAKYLESGYWATSSGLGWKYKNAGPLTHWFYLLANGGSYNGYGVPAIGWQNVEELVHTTMRWWLWHDVDYNETRQQFLSAAEYLWGWCSMRHIAVADAWAAVNVGDPLNGCPPYAYLAGPRVIQSGFKVVELPKFDVVPREEDDISPMWRVPDGWTGSVSPDGKTFTLTDVSSYSSKTIYADYTVNGQQYTVSQVVHFEDEIEEKSDNSSGREISKEKLQLLRGSEKIIIYPNPITGESVAVSIPTAQSGLVLEILDMTGRVQKRVRMQSGKNIVDVQYMPSGLYIFRFEGSSYFHIEKVLLNKQP